MAKVRHDWWGQWFRLRNGWHGRFFWEGDGLGIRVVRTGR
jgi:hypothetical protein